MEESEWKKSFRMNRDVFMILANEVIPTLSFSNLCPFSESLDRLPPLTMRFYIQNLSTRDQMSYFVISSARKCKKEHGKVSSCPLV